MNELGTVSNNDVNKEVADEVALARLSQNAREYLDCKFGGKTPQALREDKSTKRINQRKNEISEEIGYEER